MNLEAYPKYDSYKDSNIEWWPRVPSHWTIKTLKYGLYINNGQDHKDVLSEYGFPVYGSGGQFAFANDYLHDGEAILLGRKGTIDKPIYVTGKFWSVDTMFYAVCKSNLLPRFAYYYCTTIPFFYFSTSTALPSMTQDDLKNNPIALPPLHEQHAIATFLDNKGAAIDKAIRIKEQQIRLLEERRQILIQQAVTRGLDPDVPMKDSGIDWIGQIPAHWEMKRIRYAATISPSRRMDGNASHNNHVAFLPMESIGINGEVRAILKDERLVREGFTYFRKGDVIMAKITPCFENGKAAYLNKLPAEYGYGTTELHVLRPKHVTGSYLYYFINRKPFRTQGEMFMVGSAGQKRISTDYLKSQPVTVPPLDEQAEIERYLISKNNKIDKAVSIKQNQITQLKEYKTSLINAAVTGKIKVA